MVNLKFHSGYGMFYLYSMSFALLVEHEFKRDEDFHQIPTPKIWDKSLKAMVFASQRSIVRSYEIFGNRINKSQNRCGCSKIQVLGSFDHIDTSIHF